MSGCDLRATTVGWALHALEPDEERRIAEHLPHCVECRRILRETCSVTSLLAATVPDAAPPSALRERVLARAGAVRPVALGDDASDDASDDPSADGPEGDAPAAVVPLSTPPSRGPRRWALLGVAAVVLGVVLASVRAVLPGADAPSSAQQAERIVAEAEARDPAGRQATLRAGDGTPVGVVLDDDGGTATLVPLGLASPGAERAYVLWRVGGPGPVAVGVLAPDGRTLPVGAAVDAAGTQAFAVSVEPAGPVPARPSTVVADGPVV